MRCVPCGEFDEKRREANPIYNYDYGHLSRDKRLSYSHARVTIESNMDEDGRSRLTFSGTVARFDWIQARIYQRHSRHGAHATRVSIVRRIAREH